MDDRAGAPVCLMSPDMADGQGPSGLLPAVDGFHIQRCDLQMSAHLLHRLAHVMGLEAQQNPGVGPTAF